MENRDEKKKTAELRLSEKSEKKTATSVEPPQFVKEKKLFKRRSFSRQYRVFRQGGLGILDSFFNTVYITISEKSVEKEKKRLSAKGQEVSSRHFLELHHPFLRMFSFVATKLKATSAFFASFWRKGDKAHAHRWKLSFLRAHLPHVALISLALCVFTYIGITLSFPIVLRAEIGGKVIAVVENKNIVDSAINELEDNVEFILGESFRFPYEVRYTFQRQRMDTVTPKAKISEQLYTYVENFICTAGGLYVDDTLVAVCRDEKSVQDGIADFISRHHEGQESGILNDIRIVTQAYPTDSIMTSDELSQLLDEMSKPLEERKKEPLPETELSVGVILTEKEQAAEPSLLSDVSFFSEKRNASSSNRPASIDGIKLDLYSTKELTYDTEVEYDTVYVESAEHYTSMADVTTKGINGRAQITARVYYVDGKEVKREIVSETITKTPINRVISLGTRLLPEEVGITSFEGVPGRFIVPHVGKVSYYFGSREDGNHKGWDIPADEGANIYAAASGTVVVAIGQNGAFSNRPQNYFTGYGYCVVIEHEGGYSTMYAHCSKIHVTLGQKVKQGEKIAEIGNTGDSEGNHVHFEITKGGIALDPAAYLYSGKKTIYD